MERVLPSLAVPTAESWTKELSTEAVDADLALRFQAGDPEVFTRIYGLFRKKVLAVIQRQVGDAASADDIAQEVFLKVHRHCASYDPTRSFNAWLGTITARTIIDWRRKQATSRLELGAGESFEIERIPSYAPTPEGMLLIWGEETSVRLILKRLTRLQRRVLLHRLVRQLTYSEISIRLGLSLSAVKSVLHRARLILAEAASF